MSSTQALDRTEGFSDLFNRVADNIASVIQGKDDVIELVLLCLIAEGHLLLEDVPGVGKTTMAKALAASIDGTFGRMQFTPDLLPSDVVGVSIFDRSNSQFAFRPGPIFANVVLADEINRASPKTQSALLESMGERQVTVDGQTHLLPPPFLVIATQNPIEHEGTYPLPESQLDRFLMRVSIGYPSPESELEILATHSDDAALNGLRPVVSATQVSAMAAAARTVHIAPGLCKYLVDLAAATRRHRNLALGMSPRATLNLQAVARARAAAAGRDFVTPDDIKTLAEPVLAHRLLVNPEAELAGITSRDAIVDVLSNVPIPSVGA